MTNEKPENTQDCVRKNMSRRIQLTTLEAESSTPWIVANLNQVFPLSHVVTVVLLMDMQLFR